MKLLSIAPFLILFFAVLGCSFIESMPEYKRYAALEDTEEKKQVRQSLTLEFQQAKKSPLVVDIALRNQSNANVKDFVIECATFGGSDTQIDSIIKTIYEQAQSKERKIVNGINFGSVSSQTQSINCRLLDFTIAQ